MDLASFAEFLCCPTTSRRKAQAARCLAARLESQFAAFEARASLPEAPASAETAFDQPVFILSAGWRSGSTLLQRMVMAKNPEIIIWGEPYAAAAPIQSLADQLRPFCESWPAPEYFVEQYGTALADEWVANLYPPVEDFRAAHLAYCEALFAQPARQRGRRQWGLKEVRFGADEVRYLRWLYPQARFVFLVRNPFDAYRSYRRRLNWYARWPYRMVSNPYDFGLHWARLCREFTALQKQGIGLLVRYESLGEPETAAALRDHLGWDVPPLTEMTELKGWTGANSTRRHWLEQMLLRRGLGEVSGELGYG